MRKLKSFLIVLSIITFVSCSDDPTSPPDDQPTALNAKAGLNQEAEVNETVTLDGNQSTGPSGFTYLWSYEGDVPENEINFQNKTSANPTFVPPKATLFEFTLTISHGDSTNSDETTVMVGGAIELGGTLTENLELKNIQGDSELPDYIVTSDLIIENGITLSIIEDDVRIEFRSGTGINIKSGGTLTNINTEEAFDYDVEFYGDYGWKGILVENGSISLGEAKIINGGAEAFAGQDEPGAISLIGSDTRILRLNYNVFIDSRSYDIFAPGKLSAYLTGYVTRNRFSYKHPLKVSISFLGFLHIDHPNTYPESYDYSIIIPSGADIIDTPSKNLFLFEQNAKFYIDGDFRAGQDIWIFENVTIYMKEGSAILAEKKLLARVFPDSPILIEGLNGAQWKGIASVYDTDYRLAVEMQNITIKNAGYGIIKMGSFEAEEPAALVVSSEGILIDSQIINSGGFGIYHSAEEYNGFELKNTFFKNTALPAARTNPQAAGRLFNRGHNCTFELPPGIAACLVQGEGSPEMEWQSLGGENFYLIDANILDATGFRIGPGSILKFKAGRALVRTDKTKWISMRGTADAPIILDGEAGTPGSWGGIYLGTPYGLEHIIIKNGGEFLLHNATEKANVIAATPDEQGQFLEMINTTVSNSAGYGLVVETNSLSYDFENPEHQNTFSNNASGNVLVKP